MTTFAPVRATSNPIEGCCVLECTVSESIKECVWLRPEAVAQIEFLEWTEGDRLRHAKFVGLREDKNPREVVKEHGRES